MSSDTPDAPGELPLENATPLHENPTPSHGNAAPAALPPPEERLTLRYVLFGPEGLRAAWGIILFLGIYSSMLLCLLPLRRALLHAPPIQGNVLTARQTLSMEGAGILGLLVATWLLARLERRDATAYGLPRRGGLRYFLRGLVWGVALLSLLVFLLRGFGLLVFDARLLIGAAIAHYGLLWLGGFLLLAIREELFSRGYLQFTLTRGLRSVYRWLFGTRYANALGFWTAAAALSFLFGTGHSTNPDESPLGLVSAGLAGLLFCLSLWRTGSLWWAIGFHASWDWAQSFLYGVPDSGLLARGHLFTTHPVGDRWLSGGVTGPEGSLLFLPVVLIAAGIVLLTLAKTHNGYVPANDDRGQVGEQQDGMPVLP
jgi:hypothetical protein